MRRNNCRTVLFIIVLFVSSGFISQSIAVPLSPIQQDLTPSGVLSDGSQLTGSSRSLTAASEVDSKLFIEVMETRLRDSGDFVFILANAPALLERQPDNRLLRHLYTVALVVDERLIDAQRVMSHHKPSTDEVWGQVAQALIARKQNQLPQAEENIRRALTVDPQNAYALNVAGSIARARGEFTAAADFFAAAVENAPKGALYHSNLGATLLQSGDLQAAQESLETALQLNPTDCPSLVNYAALLQNMGQDSGARQYLESCLSHQPAFRPAAESLFSLLLVVHDLEAAKALVTDHRAAFSRPELALASVALHQGDGGAAVRYLQPLDDSPEVELLRAFAEAMHGNAGAAMARTRTLLAKESSSAHVALAHLGFAVGAGSASASIPEFRQIDPALTRGLFFLKGLSAAHRGDKGAMITALHKSDGMLRGITFAGFNDEQFSRMLKSAAIADLGSGFLYYAWQYHVPALDAFRAAAKADPTLAFPQLLRALAAAQLGQQEEVTAALKAALQLAPGSYAANLLMAEHAIARGNLQEALPLLTTAVSVVEDPGTVIRLGIVAETLGKEDLALENYERFVSLQPESHIGYNQLAWFLASRNLDMDRAMDLARQADSLLPGNASINDTIGWIYHLKGDHGNAAKHLRQAFEISGWSMPIIGFHLAQVEQSLGNKIRARELLEDIVAKGENVFEFSGQAQKILNEL